MYGGVGNVRGSRFGLFEDGGTLWRITIALLLAALIAIGIAFMRADRYSGAAAFILSLVAVVMMAWDHCRRTIALLAASAQDRNLDIAIQVDSVLGKALQRAQEEARAAKPGSRSTVAGRCESLLRAAFRERPLLPRLVGRLFASTSLAVLA